jgi:hypothetical protein
MVGKTGRDLADGEYPGLVLPSPYFDVLGEPRPWFKMLVYGREGSGKSTFVTGLCKAYLPYARHMGAMVQYCSSEEGPSDTSADRIQRLGVSNDNLVVTSFSTVEELKEVVEDLDAQLLVLDSANALKAQSGQGVELMKFCERQGRAIVIIAHQNTKGEAAKARGMRHECGIEIQCVQEEMPPGKAREWGLDIQAPERQGEGGDIIVHLARKKKNRFGGRVKAAPIPMKEEEVRESVPPEVIDRRVRRLKAHNQWPLTSDTQLSHPADAISSGSDPAYSASREGQPDPEDRRPGAGESPEPPRENEYPQNGSQGDPSPESPSPGESSQQTTTGTPAVGGPTGNVQPKPTHSTPTEPSSPTDPSSLMGFPSFIRTNPAQKVDLDEFDSFTLRELIENNGNAARSVSYLNKFIGWERGCVASISTNDSPGYRTEEGGMLDEPETIEAEDGETVTGKLLSFTYERFPKSTARPEAVAVTRMYLNDKLVDTICADTAKDTIETVKERYGDIEIEVLSQEHLQDAFGVEEFRRLASEIPKRQDEDMGSVPSQVRTEGFENSEVSPRGHINTDVGLVDKRALNLAKQAARGELSGMDGSGGEVLSEESLPASAEHGVELLGTEFIFYPTEQFELEVSTGSTLMVGSRSTRGDASKAESLMGFNFGAETNLAGDETSAEEAPDEGASDQEPEEEPEPAEEAGPPGLMEQVNEKIEDLPGDMQAGHVVISGTPGGRPLIDDAAREILVEMSDAVDSTTRNEATDYEMKIGDLMVFVDESKTAVSASGAEQPSYQLRASENEENVTAEDIALALKTEDFLTQVSETTTAASLEDTDSEEEPETVGEALSGRAKMAAGLDDDIVPGGFAQTAQGTFVGGDALAILQEAGDGSTQSSVTFDLAGEEHVFSIDPAPTKFIETEENGAFRVSAGSDAAEDLTVRGLLMAFEESGAIRRKALSEQIAEPEEEESAGPESAPEPSAPEPEPTEPEPAGEEEQSAFEETQQKVDNALSVLDDL